MATEAVDGRYPSLDSSPLSLQATAEKFSTVNLDRVCEVCIASQPKQPRHEVRVSTWLGEPPETCSDPFLTGDVVMRSTPPALQVQIAVENFLPGDVAISESGELSIDGHLL